MTASSRNHRDRDRGSSRAASFSSQAHSALAAVAGSVPERTKVVLGAFAVLAVIFFVRLVFLQVIVADQYSAMAEESRTVSFETAPRRGTIYDRNGIVLATSVEATTIYANPVEVSNAVDEARQLADVLGGEADDYQDLLSTPSTTFVYIKRQADVDKAEQVKELDLDGIYFISEMRREYPHGSVGGQVVGFCNADGEGLTGLELQYNDILQGTPGVYVAERGEKGFPIPGGVKEEVAAVDGQDIMISLDIKLQDTVERALEEGVEELETEEGSSIVMDAATGEIYAACSLPYMDPTDMTKSEVGSEHVKAITQPYEPGSTFKSVSAMAILESKAMGPESTMFCPSSISANDYDVSDSHEREGATYSLREILNHSSNVGISLAMDEAGFPYLHEAIERYHLTEATGVDYPGEGVGSVPDFNQWGKITGYNISFGQGISVTPLQMVRFYGTIANDGVMVTPHFLIAKTQSGEVPTYHQETVTEDLEAVEDLRSMLRSVVTDGTGVAADIEGYDVCGKTSTAEIPSEEGGYKKEVYNLGFCGFIDNSSSKLVCFVGANEVYAMRQTTQIFNDIMSNAVKQYNITTVEAK
ncbi:penicillin-binding protein 2 [Eggerthellaceae bacterium 24-137]